MMSKSHDDCIGKLGRNPYDFPPPHKEIYISKHKFSPAIDHRVRNIRVPVRSPIVKPCVGPLVVGSVTTSESELSIVFCFLTRGGQEDSKFSCPRRAPAAIQALRLQLR